MKLVVEVALRQAEQPDTVYLVLLEFFLHARCQRCRGVPRPVTQ